MKVYVVKNRRLTDFILEDMQLCKDADLLIFSDGCLDVVNYALQLTPGSSCMYDLSLLSENLDCTVCALAETDLCGTMRRSVIVAKGGNIQGVSDETATDEGSKFMPGFGYRVYEADFGLFGCVVAGDVKRTEPARVIAGACGQFFIACGFDDLQQSFVDAVVAASSDSHLSAVGICRDAAFMINGEKQTMASDGDISSFEFSPQIRYKNVLIKTLC